MQRVVSLCLQNDVAIGAHPSFPDRENFGRTTMHFSTYDIQQIIREQLNILNKIVTANGGKLHHVKPHGALYNMAAKDAILASAIACAVKDFDSNLIYYGLSGSVMIDEAAKTGLRTANEVFADRTYQPDGSLTLRNLPGALINHTSEALRQVLQMINEKTVRTINGEIIPIHADTICIHGDGSNAVEFAKAINNRLLAEGISIQKI